MHEDAPEELAYKAQVYQQLLQDYSRQLSTLEHYILELGKTLEALDELPKIAGGEAMVPLGSGVYASAKITDKGSFVVDVGANVLMKKSAAEAKAFLEKRKAKLEENDHILRDQMLKVEDALADLSERAERLAEKS